MTDVAEDLARWAAYGRTIRGALEQSADDSRVVDELVTKSLPVPTVRRLIKRRTQP